MNIFYLDSNPVKSAKAMTNKHVVKMVVESAQLLSTAHHVLDGENENLYKVTHVNHPSAVWVRKSKSHYNWLYTHFIALANEYTHRYEKTHATAIKLAELLSNPPKNIPDLPFEQPPCAMPPKYASFDSILSYRAYYVAEKLKEPNDMVRYVGVINDFI
jgi:hypothetical protein